MKRFSLWTAVLLLVMAAPIYAQNCINCSGTTNTGTNASAIGTNTAATGHSSFASGYNSSASGNYCTSIGYGVNTTGMYSTAIGKDVQASNSGFAFGREVTTSGLNAMAIGIGYNSSDKLSNTISKSLMLGIFSSSPSIILRQTSTENVPALVGVGTTNPQQMLHVEGNTLISGNGKGLLFATSETTANGNFGIRYTGSGLNFFRPTGSSTVNYLMYISNNGNVGIGTNNPDVKLQINGSAKATNIIATASLQANSLTIAGTITCNLLAGTSPKAVIVNANGTLSSVQYSAFQDHLGNHMATQNINLNGKKIINGTSDLGGIFVASNGNVRIGQGTAIPSKALEVNGGIRSKEVIVEVSNWSDFVFEKDYPLLSLSETERFIRQNGHLPNVPSAKTVQDNGVSLGEMNALLLQKIEELTLHLIELEKQIHELKKGKL